MTKKHFIPMLCLGLILTLSSVNIFGQKDTIAQHSIVNALDTRSETESDENIKNQKELTLFPNPALNSVRINSEHEINQLVITDVSGYQLYTLSLPGIKEIDISNLQSGRYFILADTNHGLQKSQFIKL